VTLDPNYIGNLIRARLPDADISITDLRGDGDHYVARVISEAFAGRTRVEQHRMIYSALAILGEGVQFLSIQTAPPS